MVYFACYEITWHWKIQCVSVRRQPMMIYTNPSCKKQNMSSELLSYFTVTVTTNAILVTDRYVQMTGVNSSSVCYIYKEQSSLCFILLALFLKAQQFLAPTD